MKKKIIGLTVSLAAAGVAASVLFIPHKVTIKEYMSGKLDGFKPQTKEVTTSLFESMKNPVKIKERNIDHAVFTGITKDGHLLSEKSLKNIWKDETVSIDYKPAVYSAEFKEGNVKTYTKSFQYDEEYELPGNPVYTSNHPYENFKEWVKQEPEIVETSSNDLSVSYNVSYEGKTYKINYNLEGGKTDNPESYTYGMGVESLKDASKDGYIFDGWFSNENKTQKITNISKDSHEDLTIYAKFHVKPKPQIKKTAQTRKTYKSTYKNYYNNQNNYSAPAQSTPAASNTAPASSSETSQAPAASTSQVEQPQSEPQQPAAPTYKYSWTSVPGGNTELNHGNLVEWAPKYYAAHNFTSYGKALLSNIQAGDIIQLNGKLLQMDGYIYTPTTNTLENVQMQTGYPDANFQTCCYLPSGLQYLVWYGHDIS